MKWPVFVTKWARLAFSAWPGYTFAMFYSTWKWTAGWIAFEWFIIVLEIAADVLFFAYIFPPKHPGKASKLHTFGFAVVEFVWLSVSGFLPVPRLLDFIVLPMIQSAYLLIFRKGNPIWKVSSAIISFSAYIAIMTFVFRLMISIYDVPTSYMFEPNSLRLISVTVLHIFHFCFLMAVMYFKNRIMDQSPQYAGILLLLPIFTGSVLYLVESILQSTQQTTSWGEGIILVTSVAALLLNILLLALFARVGQQEKRVSQLHMEAYFARLQLQHNSEIGLVHEQMRAWRHDYKNHLIALSGALEAGDTAQAQGYLSSLIDSAGNIVHGIVDSGNILLDSLLGAKLAFASNHGIQAELRAQLPDSLPLTDTDLCALIGNLLDNAIEACQRLPQDAPRFLRADIAPKRGNLFIHVENAYDGQTARLGGIFLSSKRGWQQAGIGLKNIDKIVDMAGGFCERSGANGLFTTDILLPCSENAAGKEVTSIATDASGNLRG